MKQLVGIVQAHARRHRDLPDEEWNRPPGLVHRPKWCSNASTACWICCHGRGNRRMSASSGGGKVENAEKILSLYDTDVRVIVRGKAGAEVEFGNTVLLGENRQGVIVDYEMFREPAPADSRTLFNSLVRVREGTGHCVEAVVTDRGFFSASSSQALRETGTYDGLCPRNPKEIGERMRERDLRVYNAGALRRRGNRNSQKRIPGSANAGQGIFPSGTGPGVGSVDPRSLDVGPPAEATKETPGVVRGGVSARNGEAGLQPRE